jgi:hypothetical protein
MDEEVFEIEEILIYFEDANELSERISEAIGLLW